VVTRLDDRLDGRRRYRRPSSIASASRLPAAEASARSREHSPAKESRPRMAGAAGGRRPCGASYSARQAERDDALLVIERGPLHHNAVRGVASPRSTRELRFCAAATRATRPGGSTASPPTARRSSRPQRNPPTRSGPGPSPARTPLRRCLRPCLAFPPRVRGSARALRQRRGSRHCPSGRVAHRLRHRLETRPRPRGDFRPPLHSGHDRRRPLTASWVHSETSSASTAGACVSRREFG
jgi:hypothetical protein